MQILILCAPKFSGGSSRLSFEVPVLMMVYAGRNCVSTTVAHAVAIWFMLSSCTGWCRTSYCHINFVSSRLNPVSWSDAPTCIQFFLNMVRYRWLENTTAELILSHCPLTWVALNDKLSRDGFRVYTSVHSNFAHVNIVDKDISMNIEM